MSKHRSLSQRLFDYLTFGLVRVFQGLIWVLGERLAYLLARLLGLIWYGLASKRRRIVRRNLEITLGDVTTPQERQRIARSCFQHILCVPIELMLRPRLVGRDNWHRYFEVDPTMERAMATPHPQGLGILSAHLGNWEVGQYFCGLRGFLVSPVMRTLDNPHLDRLMVRMRSEFGETIIRKRGAARSIFRLLRTGNAVAVLPDQSAGRDGAFLDFFGVPASTHIGTADLLVKTQSDLIFITCIRLGYRFKFRYLARSIPIPTQGDERQRARALMESYLRLLEELIRRYPEQYLWMHRRFKRRPPGCSSLYD